MNELQNLFKALSDETRLRILVLLFHKKLCVCQIQGILKESQPKVSKHLAKLRDMGIVKDERQEQFIYYYIDKDNMMLRSILKMIIEDSEKFQLLIIDLEELKKSDLYIEKKRKQISKKI